MKGNNKSIEINLELIESAKKSSAPLLSVYENCRSFPDFKPMYVNMNFCVRLSNVVFTLIYWQIREKKCKSIKLKIWIDWGRHKIYSISIQYWWILRIDFEYRIH